MSVNGVDDLSVIIRSVGERTEALCMKSVLSQGISKDNLYIVSNAPFSRTLEDSYRLALLKNKKWTLCLDADVILRLGSIRHLLEFANKQDANVFEIQGMVWDKFFGGPRPAGNHLYRTEYLDRAVNLISHDPKILRPENHVLLKMKEIGFPWIQMKYCLGIHDFEQYNKDIFRKAMLHSRKHSNYLSLFIPHWSEHPEDEDFAVAIEGFLFGFKKNCHILCDVNTKMPEIKEKIDLNTTKFDWSKIESILISEPNKYYSIELARIAAIPSTRKLKCFIIIYRFLNFLQRKIRLKIFDNLKEKI